MLEKNGLILSLAVMANLLTTGNVFADKLNSTLVECREVSVPEMQNILVDWSANVTAVLNKEMDSKLQQIVVRAERLLLLERQTRNILSTLEQEVESGSTYN